MGLAELSDVVVLQETQHRAVALETRERRIETGNLARPGGRVPHLVGFLQVAGHARLAQDVLTSGQARKRHLVMRSGRCRDNDGVDVRRLGDVPPVGYRLAEPKLACNSLSLRQCAVPSHRELHALDGLETRDVPRLRDGSDTYDSDSDVLHLGLSSVRYRLPCMSCVPWHRWTEIIEMTGNNSGLDLCSTTTGRV